MTRQKNICPYFVPVDVEHWQKLERFCFFDPDVWENVLDLPRSRSRSLQFLPFPSTGFRAAWLCVFVHHALEAEYYLARYQGSNFVLCTPWGRE